MSYPSSTVHRDAGLGGFVFPMATFHLYERGDRWWIRIQPFQPSWRHRVEDRPCTAAEIERHELAPAKGPV